MNMTKEALELTKTIWLVRHGQSQAQNGEDDDPLDSNLSQLGRQQGRRLVGPLSAVEFDCILISPLKRAWQTYQLSQAKGKRVEFDSRLIESNWGIASWYDKILPVSMPDSVAADQHNAWLKSVQERSAELVADLLDRAAENILLFGHWGVFCHIFLAFAGLEDSTNPVGATMDNAAISRLEVDDRGRRFIRCWNDHAHVMDLLE